MTAIRIAIVGTAPLLMHSVRLADPLDPIVRQMKAITSDRKLKGTDEGIEQLARLEFAGGLYHDPQMGPYLPAENLYKSILTAARATRDGKTIERALLMLEDSPLAYDGPRDVDGLWADPQFRDRRVVAVSRNKVTRTRPRFDRWAAEFDADLDLDRINFNAFVDIVDLAGRSEGVGDFRPRFGRFTAKVSKL